MQPCGAGFWIPLQRQPWLRAAFVLLLHRQSEHGLAQFRGWLARFNEHTGARLGYPLVLFVDRVAKWRFLQFECPMRLHFIAVADADWTQFDASLSQRYRNRLPFRLQCR